MAKTLAQLTTLFNAFESNGSTSSQFNTFKNDVHGGEMYWMILPVESYIRAFQATKNFTYLNKALDVWYQFQSRAYKASSFPNAQLPPRGSGTSTTNFNDSFLSWDSHSATSAFPIGNSTGGGEYSLYQLHGSQCIPLLMSVMYHNPIGILDQTHGNATWTAGWNKISQQGGSGNWGTTYQDVLDSMLPFFETNMWDKWDVKNGGSAPYGPRGGTGVGLDEYLFRSQTHIAAHAANMALYLWKITGKQKYKNFLDDWNFDCNGHGYNSSTTAGFEFMLRAHTYPDTTPTYAGFIWENTWANGKTGDTDTNHWQAELRHIANQLMFTDSYWTGRVVDGRNFKTGMLNTAKWCLNNSENELGNYKPSLTPSTSDPSKLDGSASTRSAMIYYGASAWGRFDPAFQSDIEDSDLVNSSPSGSQRVRATLMTANAMYNRAYLDGSPMFMEIPSGDPVTAITFVNDTQTLFDGDTANLAVNFTPSSPSNANYTTSSDTPSVVDDNGNFVGVGTAIITATAEDTTNGTITDTLAITCSPTAAASVLVTPSVFSILVAGTVQLNVGFTPPNTTDQTGTWGTSNGSIATVNSSGLVTGVALGGCTITFTSNDGGFQNSCNITVTDTITDSILQLSPLVYYTPESIDPAVTVDGNAISIWEDISGNGLDATVVGGCKLNVSGTRQVEFDGTGWLDIANDASLNLVGGTDEFTIVFREGDVPSLTSGYAIGKVSTGSFIAQYGMAYGGGVLNGVYVGGVLSGFTNIPNTTNRLIIAVISTTGVDVWINDIQVLSGGTIGSAVTSAGQSANIGGRTDGSYLMNAGSHLDLVAIIPSAIDGTQRAAIQVQYGATIGNENPAIKNKGAKLVTSFLEQFNLNGTVRRYK